MFLVMLQNVQTQSSYAKHLFLELPGRHFYMILATFLKLFSVLHSRQHHVRAGQIWAFTGVLFSNSFFLPDFQITHGKSAERKG